MIDPSLYNALLKLSFLLAGGIFIALFFINAPYGRHVRTGDGDRSCQTTSAGW